MTSVANFQAPCPARYDVALRDHTTFRMGGKVPVLLEPRNRDELIAAVRRLHADHIRYRMLGGGANILIDDSGLDEAIVLTTGFAFMVRESEDATELRLGAGLSIPQFVTKTREMGLTGAECLVGVPGTMGGATVMNAGGRHGWLSSIAKRVRYLTPALDEQEDAVTERTFGYRSSMFDACVVLETVVALQRDAPKAVQERIKTILKEKSAAQPLIEPSAGCIFKNPEGQSAGRLIEAAGLKGARVGDAEVSTKHGNFIVNRGAATFRDVIQLIRHVRKGVLEHSGADLHTEVKIWSREPLDLPTSSAPCARTS
ncbi:MAG: UDP-N-acetylmuramate dehydrogenase [Planctomycetes bacterium]|nr:UDP-N-acetylmuramate dehydrogenase [Planctomycetota bacterium]MCC7170645.1 UDP-N-acetylmuramate dehydrogenase [Planctomycetota bacterium]